MADIATTFNLPGYSQAQEASSVPLASSNANGQPTINKIPAWVWMFVFLVVGYVGLRLVMED